MKPFTLFNWTELNQKCICLGFKKYLSRFQKVFVKISKIYLSPSYIGGWADWAGKPSPLTLFRRTFPPVSSCNYTTIHHHNNNQEHNHNKEAQANHISNKKTATNNLCTKKAVSYNISPTTTHNNKATNNNNNSSATSRSKCPRWMLCLWIPILHWRTWLSQVRKALFSIFKLGQNWQQVVQVWPRRPWTEETVRCGGGVPLLFLAKLRLRLLWVMLDYNTKAESDFFFPQL